jgi:hypothetical protein
MAAGRRQKATPECCYLYPDGHLVEKYVTAAKVGDSRLSIDHVVIRERFAEPGFWTGRIIIRDSGYLPMFRGARVEPKLGRVEGGSENTRKLGICVDSVTVRNADGFAVITGFPDLISSGVRYQPDVTEELFDPELTSWADYPVTKVIRADAKVAR